MKAGGGKQKGAEWERECCKKLSLFITEGKREDVFWRSAMSGGRATVQAKKGIENRSQSGDISSVAEEGNLFTDVFCIEAKYYADLKLRSLVFGKPVKDSILDYWKQTQTQAILCRQEPILIVKQNRQEPLFCVSIMSKIGKYLAEEWLEDEGIPMLGVFPWLDLAIFSFDDFLEGVDPVSLMYNYNKLSVVK
jgi:hypothetical protein